MGWFSKLKTSLSRIKLKKIVKGLGSVAGQLPIIGGVIQGAISGGQEAAEQSSVIVQGQAPDRNRGLIYAGIAGVVVLIVVLLITRRR